MSTPMTPDGLRAFLIHHGDQMHAALTEGMKAVKQGDLDAAAQHARNLAWHQRQVDNVPTLIAIEILDPGEGDDT